MPYSSRQNLLRLCRKRPSTVVGAERGGGTRGGEAARCSGALLPVGWADRWWQGVQGAQHQRGVQQQAAGPAAFECRGFAGRRKGLCSNSATVRIWLGTLPASPSSTSTATRSRPLLLAGNGTLLLLLLRPRPLPSSRPTALSAAAVVETAASGSTARSAPRRCWRPPRCAGVLSCRRRDAQGAQQPGRRHRRAAAGAAGCSCGDAYSEESISVTDEARVNTTGSRHLFKPRQLATRSSLPRSGFSSLPVALLCFCTPIILRTPVKGSLQPAHGHRCMMSPTGSPAAAPAADS